MNKVEGELNERRDPPTSVDTKHQYCQGISSSELNLYIQGNAIRTPQIEPQPTVLWRWTNGC